MSTLLSPTGNDKPYTTADEDPFCAQPYTAPTKIAKNKRSSLLDKWINEQLRQPSEELSFPDPVPPSPAYFVGTSRQGSWSNPYLAYPDLPRLSSERTKCAEEDNESIISYDLVDDDDIPNDPVPLPQTAAQEAPVTPNIPRRTHKSSRNSITPSLRNLALSFRNHPLGDSPSHNNMETASRAFARLSFFPRTPRSSTGPQSVSSPETPSTPQPHTRSSSISTLGFNVPSPSSAKIIPSSASNPKWRPSVLGHFQQSSISEASSIDVSEQQYAPSRPSVSSADTYSTWNTSRTTTSVDSNIPSTPSKVSLFESIRLRGNRSPTIPSTIYASSSSSVRLSAPQTGGIVNSHATVEKVDIKGKGMMCKRVPLAPKHGSTLYNIDDEDDLDEPPTYRFTQHASVRPTISQSSSGTLPRVKFSSLNMRAHRKRKKLIVSGVGASETRKLEGVKRWCESFGEVKQITRMPNGDLQFDFRDPEVADTVCRVRAKVFISGVGSVQLSWITNKR